MAPTEEAETLRQQAMAASLAYARKWQRLMKARMKEMPETSFFAHEGAVSQLMRAETQELFRVFAAAKSAIEEGAG
jgi:hypothetical protein